MCDGRDPPAAVPGYQPFYPIRGAYPDRPLAVFKNSPDIHASQSGRGDPAGSADPVQSIGSADPDAARPVFGDGVHRLA